MASFDQTRKMHAETRQAAQQADSRLRSLRAQLELQQRELADLARRYSHNDPGHVKARAGIEQTIQSLEGQISKASISKQSLQGAALDAWKAFQTFTDPRRSIQQWSDNHPILLFPLRLETRFKRFGNNQDQLWVRIYPDECLIDLFHETPTDMEAQELQQFWANIWVADGDETRERAAWSALVATIGTGRAGWLVQHYLPTNQASKPVKNNPEDIFLCLPATEAVPAAVLTYWQAMWIAAEDLAGQQAAYATMLAAVGEEESNRWINLGPPLGFSQVPAEGLTRTDVNLLAVVLEFPDKTEAELRPYSWTDAPRVNLLPDRFVFMGYRGGVVELTEIGGPVRGPLQVGIDPGAEPDEQLQSKDGEVSWPEELKWMVDFPAAVDRGMGFRINLNALQARDGFDRVLVVGIRSSSDETESRQELEQLLMHHLYSKKNLSIVPQGTPTNNTEQTDSGYRFLDDSDESFNLFFKRQPAYLNQSDNALKSDGQWLAEALGLSPELAQFIPNGETMDAAEASDMNKALWEGTLGYWMKSEMAPVFSEEEIRQTYRFFTQYVSGRGRIPALRMGKQPYGILPTAAVRRGVNWFDPLPTGGDFFQGNISLRYLRALNRLYLLAEQDTDAWLSKVDRVGQPGDAHKQLLSILGLHPASVEYYPLLGEDPEVKFNEMKTRSPFMAGFFARLFNLGTEDALQFLRDKGENLGDIVPKILERIYSNRLVPLDGPVIDDVPLSETDKVRPYAGTLNYLEWLVQAAETGLDALRTEQGFDDNQRPQALLYLLLRHALQLGFDDAGKRLMINDRLPYTSQFIEPTYLHIDPQQKVSPSRYHLLYQPFEQTTLEQHLAKSIRLMNNELTDALQAIERLAPVPTARLERAFAEHLDLLNYRFDAWRQAMITWKLEQMRFAGQNETYSGIYLGAYAWLEPLRPQGRTLSPAQVPAAYEADINKGSQIPLMVDSSNAGAIHAPSLDHATTAAVLRNGYLNGDGRLAVGLTSARVRLALGIVEGIRNGQSLGALLGYQLERFVHEDTNLLTRTAVYTLRKLFPLVADRLQATRSDNSVPIEAIAASNVVDGRRLLQQIENSGVKTYPFGLATAPALSADQVSRVNGGVDLIMDINDAVSDLAIAEGVHQAVKGNFERSAGTLDAFARGELPPEPEVVQTPRRGRAITHRVALHLSQAEPGNPWPAITFSARAKAEPRLNAWLAGHLPPPDQVVVVVAYTRASDSSAQTRPFSLQELQLQPLDLLFLNDAGTEKSLGELDELLLASIYSQPDISLNEPIEIRYTTKVPGKVTWFQLTALVDPLRRLLASRSLLPSDLRIHHEARSAEEGTQDLPESRVLAAQSELANLLPGLTALPGQLANPALLIDDQLTAFASTMQAARPYPQTAAGGGEVWNWRQRQVKALKNRMSQLADTFQTRLTQADVLLAELDAAPGMDPEEARNLLRNAEILLSSAFQFPEPATLADHRLVVDGKRTAFSTQLNTLQSLLTGPVTSYGDFLAACEAQLPLDAFLNEPFDLAAERAEVERYKQELISLAETHRAAIERVLAQVSDLLTAANSEAGPKQVRLRQDAAKALFGEAFQIVPSVRLPDSLVQEVQNAWGYAQGPDLLSHAIDTLGYLDPVNEWLHGTARVREKMSHLEQSLLIGEAMQLQPLQLAPLQLPFDNSLTWLALEYPVEKAPQQDQLLYTAIWSEPPLIGEWYGLLLDEWTEVIPEMEETTAVTFHFDRPNSEAPQAMLLVLPAQQNGSWTWDELTEALNDTLLTAQKRALEPSHQDGSPYSRFLPATVSSYTYPETNISLPYLRMQGIYHQLDL